MPKTVFGSSYGYYQDNENKLKCPVCLESKSNSELNIEDGEYICDSCMEDDV